MFINANANYYIFYVLYSGWYGARSSPSPRRGIQRVRKRLRFYTHC